MKIIKKLLIKVKGYFNELYYNTYGVKNEYSILDKMFGRSLTDILMSLVTYIGFIIFVFFTLQFFVFICEIMYLVAKNTIGGSIEVKKIAMPYVLDLVKWMLISCISAVICYDVNVSISKKTGAKFFKVLVVIMIVLVLSFSDLPVMEKLIGVL